jgi:hypothetical protein
MPNLQSRIQTLADSFAQGVLAAIRSASLEEILSGGGAAPKRGPGRPPKAAATAPAAPRAAAVKPAKRAKGGRLPRRSPSDIEHVIGLITTALSNAGKGLRSEELQKVLKLSKKEIVGPLAQALGSKRITKKGQKRATTYFAK